MYVYTHITFFSFIVFLFQSTTFRYSAVLLPVRISLFCQEHNDNKTLLTLECRIQYSAL